MSPRLPNSSAARATMRAADTAIALLHAKSSAIDYRNSPSRMQPSIDRRAVAPRLGGLAMRLVLCVIVTVLLAAAPAPAQTLPRTGKHALALDLIETSGVMRALSQIVDNQIPQIVEGVRKNNPQVSEATLDALRRVAREELKAG